MIKIEATVSISPEHYKIIEPILQKFYKAELGKRKITSQEVYGEIKQLIVRYAGGTLDDFYERLMNNICVACKVKDINTFRLSLTERN